MDLLRRGLVDPVDAGEAAVFNTDREAYRPGGWGLQMLRDLVNQYVPSVGSDPMQNLYKMGNVGLSALGGQAMMRTPAAAGQLGALVYHGSPHKFDKFDSSKIGTGEGAQAYGHGLYFAENPAVALDYRQRLSKPQMTVEEKYRAYDPTQSQDIFEQAAGRLLAKHTGKVDAAIAEAKTFVDHPDTANVIKKLEGMRTAKVSIKPGTEGSMYRVDLPDTQIAKMLDWDKPLSEQPESVRKAMESSGLLDAARQAVKDRFTSAKSIEALTGADIEGILRSYAKDAKRGTWFDMGVSGNKELASSRLKEMGIPGIKYLDQGSRAGGKGTYNFVVFDDQIPKIVGRE